MADLLRTRLLHDIAELQTNPYPNITLHIHDEYIEEACLVLKTEGYGELHLSVEFPADYPLLPPEIRMDSDVFHPNVEGDYICASILMTEEGYTPAYTLKGIAIQLLSFFSSDGIEQVGGEHTVALESFKKTHANQVFGATHCCEICGFGMGPQKAPASTVVSALSTMTTMSTLSTINSTPPISNWGEDDEVEALWNNLEKGYVPHLLDQDLAELEMKDLKEAEIKALIETGRKPPVSLPRKGINPRKGIQRLPDEILLLICDQLETTDLLLFGEAWYRLARVTTKYDLVHIRDMKCFVFRTDFRESKLGIGIEIDFSEGKQGFIQSDFDLLSEEGYYIHGVKRSVQGIPFEHWLPLPISEEHWASARYDVEECLFDIQMNARLGAIPPIQVLIHFMNDVMVKLNKDIDRPTIRQPFYPYEEIPNQVSPMLLRKQWNLTFTSSTYCYVWRPINQNFDVEITEGVLKSLLKEAITRNAVWTLKEYPELAYMEPSPGSDYRLKHTFLASLTSYRIFMFLNTFRIAARGAHKPLFQLCSESFSRHGAPPPNATFQLLQRIKHIHSVNTFRGFLEVMGVGGVSPEGFTGLLRGCMRDAQAKGYIDMPLSQGLALGLRLKNEPGVAVAVGVKPEIDIDPSGRGLNFHGKRGRGRGR